MEHDSTTCPNTQRLSSLEAELKEFKTDTKGTLESIWKKFDTILEKIDDVKARITGAAIGIICAIIGGVTVAVIMMIVGMIAKGGTP